MGAPVPVVLPAMAVLVALTVAERMAKVVEGKVVTMVAVDTVEVAWAAAVVAVEIVGVGAPVTVVPWVVRWAE